MGIRADRNRSSMLAMQQLVEEEPGEEIMKRVEVFRDLLARTLVGEVTWINAIVRYLVSPREAGSVKTRLSPRLLAALNAEPDRAMVPPEPTVRHIHGARSCSQDHLPRKGL